MKSGITITINFKGSKIHEKAAVLALSLSFVLTGCTASSVASAPSAQDAAQSSGTGDTSAASNAKIDFKKLSDNEWQARLTPEQYKVLRKKDTERAFTGKYWDNHQAGSYKCAGCGAQLFSSETKFESGTGWPSFTAPVEKNKVAVEADNTYGMTRNEVVCSNCGAHLGHVFDNGPAPGGQRYCINSVSLDFKKSASKDKILLAKDGGQATAPAATPDSSTDATKDLAIYDAKTDEAVRKEGKDVAYFAGGCFWGVEDAFKAIKGVEGTTVGYTGGKKDNPSYEDVCSHTTGHAEAVRVVYDPAQIKFTALTKEFLALHDPTTKDRQGPDVGDQYRSAIFYHNAEEEKEAKDVIAKEQNFFGMRPIVTSLEPLSKFYTAEDYHQDYFAKHPGQGCHYRPKTR